MTGPREEVAVPPGRIFAFPKAGISYNDSFYRCVEEQQGTVVEGVFAGGWLWRNLQPGDWIHLHWPSFSYNTGATRAGLLRNFGRWLMLLALVRLRRARIVWTAHNLFPHDRAVLPWVDVLARHVLIALSARIMVHGEQAAQCLVQRFPAAAGKLCVIPHGHWIGYYPVTTTRRAARQELGLPEQRRVFLFIGLCKPYKNLHGLVATFRELPGDAMLLVAGKFSDPAYHAQVQALCAGDDRIRMYPGFVPDEMMQTYLLACDAVVVPYLEILTSGTAMLAMSFGRPVVSVATGFLKDVVGPRVGRLFEPGDPQGLRAALASFSQGDYVEDEILAHARHFSFDKAARLFLASLHSAGPVRR